MLDHHIQRTIVLSLAFTPAMTFSQLKPDDLENKLFTYHLKKTITAGYVQKSEDGLYSLTPEGRRLSTGVEEKQQALVVERPLSALFLVMRRKSDGAWLMYERQTHPMLGYKGFPHLRPNASVDSIESFANEQIIEKAGVKGSFQALGGGYVRIFKGQELESYTHFTLLFSEDIEGEIEQNDDHIKFYWDNNPDFESAEMFPTTLDLKQLYDKHQPFFIEKTYTI